jgi:primosomal replication protein N
MNAIEFVATHPIVALTVGAIHLAVAETLYKLSVPTVIMQGFQLGAWTITIIVGLITIYGFLTKKKKKHE